MCEIFFYSGIFLANLIHLTRHGKIGQDCKFAI